MSWGLGLPFQRAIMCYHSMCVANSTPHGTALLLVVYPGPTKHIKVNQVVVPVTVRAGRDVAACVARLVA